MVPPDDVGYVLPPSRGDLQQALLGLEEATISPRSDLQQALLGLGIYCCGQQLASAEQSIIPSSEITGDYFSTVL